MLAVKVADVKKNMKQKEKKKKKEHTYRHDNDVDEKKTRSYSGKYTNARETTIEKV